MPASQNDVAGQALRCPRKPGGAPALPLAIASLSVFLQTASAASFDSAAKVTNAFGLDLYRKIAAGDRNLCLSPYSISCALAMTLAGADGETRTEMSKVLHVDPNTDIDPSFAALQKSLEEVAVRTAKIAQDSKKTGGPSEPITIAIANRLFPQSGYDFRPQFFARIKEYYGAPPESFDFKADAAAATKRINDWVAKQTRDRFRDLISRPLDPVTRLVLANAIYLKAPWADEFSEHATKPEPFHIKGGAPVEVAMMHAAQKFGYRKQGGYTAVALPYSGAELQFVVFLPDQVNGLRSLEQNLNAQTLATAAQLPPTDVDLHLPKFKFEPPTIQLSEQLQALGMKTAFDIPEGSANFDRMAPRKPNSYLAISQVFHKTFIAVDEKGTEAAAATAAVMMEVSARMERTKPIEVKVDRPFVYAIQHVPSGACLFIGRVNDPR